MTHNLAFYTVFYGSDSNTANVIPPTPSTIYDCYYFTNNKNTFERLKNTKWISIFINDPTTDDLIESCMKAKLLKSMPESYHALLKYKYLCFFDTKIVLNDTIVENILNTTFADNIVSMVLRKHPAPNNSVHYELYESLFQHRYKTQEEQYRKYIDGQISNGLSPDIDTDEFHLACGFIIRDMTHPKTLEINKTWYEHIQLCGIQDQISFFFVKQLFKAYIKSCPWDIVY
jgi:hypothetical protein